MDADLLTRLQRRRRFLGGCTYGIGAMAMANLIATDAPLKAAGQQMPPHLPRARRVIFLNMSGGPSQLDLFDPKPQLQKWHGKRVPDFQCRIPAPFLDSAQKEDHQFECACSQPRLVEEPLG